jgi:hypothetical protein
VDVDSVYAATGKGGIPMLKIAVATSDGQKIDEHFGQAKAFQIYDVAEDVRSSLSRNGTLPLIVPAIRQSATQPMQRWRNLPMWTRSSSTGSAPAPPRPLQGGE